MIVKCIELVYYLFNMSTKRTKSTKSTVLERVLYDMLMDKAKKCVLRNISFEGAEIHNCESIPNISGYKIFPSDMYFWPMNMENIIHEQKIKTTAQDLISQVFRIYGMNIWCVVDCFYYRDSTNNERSLDCEIKNETSYYKYYYRGSNMVNYELRKEKGHWKCYINEFCSYQMNYIEEGYEYGRDRIKYCLLLLLLDPLRFIGIANREIKVSSARCLFDTLKYNIKQQIDTFIIRYWIMGQLFSVGLVKDVCDMMQTKYIELLF